MRLRHEANERGRSRLTEDVSGRRNVALEQLHQLHTEYPEHALVCVALGVRLLQQGTDAGAALI